MADGLTGAECSFVVVADDSAQEPIVARGHPVVVVERDAGECRHINPELRRVWDMLREDGVQGVDAFDDEHRVVL